MKNYLLLHGCLSAFVFGSIGQMCYKPFCKKHVLNAPKDATATGIDDNHCQNGSRSVRTMVFCEVELMCWVRFLSPADKGIAFSSHHIRFFYLSLVSRKTRRIASHVKNTRFAGTDYTYEDLEAKQVMPIIGRCRTEKSVRLANVVVAYTEKGGQDRLCQEDIRIKGYLFPRKRFSQERSSFQTDDRLEIPITKVFFIAKLLKWKTFQR